MDDLYGLRRGVAQADAVEVVHTAFDHDFTRFAETSEADRRAIKALGDELAGSDRPLVVTAVLPLVPGRAATEDDEAPTGVSAYVGDGGNRWLAVHRLDEAPLYRLALEVGVAGARYHAVGEEGVPLRAVAEAVGRGLGVPVESLKSDEAAPLFGWLAFPASMDAPASSALTRRRLGWRPAETAGFLDDFRASTLFQR